MGLFWAFFKVTLRSDATFLKRQQILIGRFQAANTYTRKIRGTQYTYGLFDVEVIKADKRTYVAGHLTREPMVARGRSLNRESRRSTEDAVNVPDIADYTEFIYDVPTCVLALRRRGPFTAYPSIAKALTELLGEPFKAPAVRGGKDVHVELLRDAKYADEKLDTDDRLIEANLVYAKPNPTAGDDGLATVHLGLLGEEIDADEVGFKAKKKTGGTLDKSRNGFLRRSIKFLLDRGYLKKGELVLGSRKIDLLKAREKIRETVGYTKDEEGNPKGLRGWVLEWMDDLLSNDDIYRSNGDE